jgi:hypothetical protein
MPMKRSVERRLRIPATLREEFTQKSKEKQRKTQQKHFTEQDFTRNFFRTRMWMFVAQGIQVVAAMIPNNRRTPGMAWSA